MKELLSEALKKDLPGEKAQFQMAPEGRKNFESSGLKQFAAVLILLYLFKDETYIVFIKRPDYEGVHGGQIAFPGGKLEPTDENLKATALRETQEELGVETNIEILGKLSPLYIPVSGFEVYPYVGFSERRPLWKPDKKEVDEVLEIPVSFFQNPLNKKSEQWDVRGIRMNVPFYQYMHYKIWGATAMIMAEFLEVIRKSK